MTPHLRIFWLIALVFFTTGCSGYRGICYTRSDVPGLVDPELPGKCDIWPGDNVVLILVDGEKVEGKVKLVSAHEIVLNHEGLSIQPRGYAADRIQPIEITPDSPPSGGTTLIVIGALLVVGGAILYAETESLRNGFMSSGSGK
jgi:hypothetical protein